MTLAGLFSAIVAMSACGADEETTPSPVKSPENSNDASSKGGAHSTPAPGGTGVCCTPSAKPACCMDYGGYAESDDACNRRLCDGMAPPSAAWRLEKEEHGCDAWIEPPKDGLLCCGCAPIPDSGADADASDAE
ncbi:hypothetical protein [Labilithrix luteola]|nr:hypothetical protein [Labilithrix luteola]